MSAATPSTASSTSCTSPSPTLPDEASAIESRLQAAAQARGAAQDGGRGDGGDASGQAAWSAGAQPDGESRPAAPDRPRSRIAWCITGSGHYLEESLAIAARLPDVDLFLSAAGEEVLPFYGRKLDELKQQFRVYRDRSASAVPVGMLYEDVYHTVVIAPATSNTVAKCAFGISDTLPTNLFAQAGKLGVLGIVFACDTEPVVVTTAPRTSDQEWFTLRPRRIELENVERLRAIDHCQVVTTPAELDAALSARLAGLAARASS